MQSFHCHHNGDPLGASLRSLGGVSPRWVWKTPPEGKVEAPTVSQSARFDSAEASAQAGGRTGRPQLEIKTNRVKSWNDEIDRWAQKFLKDLEEDIRGEHGIFQNEIAVKGAGEFRKLMILRAQAYANHLKARIAKLEQARGEQLDDQEFDDEASRILDETDASLQALKDQVINASQVFAKKEGHGTKIDTYEELWLFNQNLGPFFQDLETPSGRAKWQLDAETLIPTVEAALKPQQAIVEKLVEGKDLTAAEYEAILKNLKKRWDEPFERKNDQLKTLERTGALLPLHAMSAKQRFELGKHAVATLAPAEARKGVLFLSQLGFLDIEQAQVLFGSMGENLSEQEISDIQQSHTAVEEAKELFAKLLKRGPTGNMLLRYGTSSNVLIYEVTGRLALLGAIVPLLLNIGKPNRWPDIILDPVWLGCVGIGAASVEHISGGMGKGKVSRKFAKWSETPEELKKDEKAQRFEDNKRGELDTLCGNHPETVKFLLANNAAVLGKINAIEDEYEQEEHKGYFLFSFKALVEHDLKEEKRKRGEEGQSWTRAMEKTEKDRLTGAYERGRDGVGTAETGQAIQAIYHLLSYDLKLSEVGEMVEEIEQGRARRGIV